MHLDTRQLMRAARRRAPNGSRRGQASVVRTAKWSAVVDVYGVQAGRGRWSAECLIDVDGDRGELVIGGSPPIALVALPLHFGGARWYARCPACGARCAVLHLRPGSIVCRWCVRPRPHKPSKGRPGHVPAQRIRERLAWTPDGKPKRPPRMHRRTYQRLLAEHERRDAHELARMLR